MAIRDSLKSLAGSYNPALSLLQNALNIVGRKANEKAVPIAASVAKEIVAKPIAKAAVTGVAAPVAAYKTLTGDVAGANRVLDQGFNIPGLGQMKPVGARTEEEIARGQTHASTGRELAEIGATGASVAALHPAAFGFGGAPKLAAGAVSQGQKALGALPTLAERVIPKSTTIKTALGRLGVQGAADFVPGAVQSAASDVLQGKTDVGDIAKRAGVSGLFSAALPITLGGGSGLIKGAARQVGQGRTKAQQAKNILRTVAEETGAITKSAQSIQDAGNLGRQVRKALEEKEAALAARVAQAEGALPADALVAGARVEGGFAPTAMRGEASKLDKAKLKLVQQIRDFTKNWIDDRAPLTVNLSGKAKMAGATDEEVEQLTAAVNDVRTSDAKSFARLNRVRENTDAIRPQNMGEADFDALVNKYSIAKSEAETIRDTDVLQRAAQAEVDALESTLDPETLAAVRQAHEINVRQFNDEILQSQVDSGMISAETAAKYRAEKPNYTKFIVEEKLPTDTDVLRGVGGARRGDVKGVKDAARSKELTDELAKLPAKEANAVGAIIAERQNAKNIQATRAVDLDQKYGTGVFTPVWTEADETAKQALIKRQMELGEQKQELITAAKEKLDALKKERIARNVLEAFRKDGAKSQTRAFRSEAKEKIGEKVNEIRTGIREDLNRFTEGVDDIKGRNSSEAALVREKTAAVEDTLRNERRINAERNKFVAHVKSVVASLKKGESPNAEAIAELKALIATRSGRDTAGIEAALEEIDRLNLEKQATSGKLETIREVAKGPAKNVISDVSSRLKKTNEIEKTLDNLSVKLRQDFDELLKLERAKRQSAMDGLAEIRDKIKLEIDGISAERKTVAEELFALNKKQAGLEGAKTITLRRNGVEEYYKVNDRQVADYFRGKDQELGQIAQVAARAANWTRQFATGANPAFAATNAIRDYATARDMLATRGITLTAGDWMDGLRAGRSIIFKKQGSKLDPLAKEAYELGGLLNSMSTRARSTDDITQAVSNLSKRKSTVLSRLEDWNNQTELATRIAVLKAAKRAGIKDKAQLRELIRDSTVDFQVGGQMMREWNKAIPFMNARLQGLRNVVKRIADDPAKATRVGQLYTNFAQTLIDAQNARYGDVANRINPTERQDNFVLVLGTYEDNGQKQPLYVRVPKGSIGQMAGMVKDAVDPIPGDTRSARERTEDLLIGFTRFSPIQGIPSIGGSFVDTWKGLSTNKDWRNYNIVPEYLNKPGVSPLMQKTKTTSESVTAAVEALNRVTGGSDTTEGSIALSPAKTEFALRTLFSGVGNQAVGAADMLYNLATKGSPVPSNLPDGSALGVASKLPILSSFVRSRALSTDPQVEQKNIEASRQVSLIQGREKESAEQMLERIKAASPEERVKIIEENPALAEEAAKRLQERSFIEGVNPIDSLANQGIQLYNALASKQTPEEQADLLKRVQEYRASSPNGVIYSQAYALVEKIKQSSQEERVALVQQAQENGLFNNEKFTEALGIYLQMK